MFLAVIRRFPLLRVVNFWPGDDFLGSSSAKTSIFPRNFLERKSCRDPYLSIRLSRRTYTTQLPVPLARAASSASRVPSAWRPSRPRAAPPPPCTLAHASASASADRLSWATPLRRRLVSRRHVARASPARSADFDLRALDPPMAASDGPRGQRPPERVRRCAESELNQQIIPSRPASLSRAKRAAAATLQAIDRSLDE